MRKLLAATSLSIVFGASSAAALNNSNHSVKSVDAAAGNTLYVYLLGNVTSLPTCGSGEPTAVACSLTDEFCRQASSLALAARLAGKNVDFQVGTTCIGAVATFSRFRIN